MNLDDLITEFGDIEHRWELRLEEFEDGHSFRRFECIDCGAVRYE